jgi:signal transduction histidine kinase
MFMKLIHQINLAFAVSLVLVLSVTAVVIHYVLLDHFIGTQKADLKSVGSAVSASLTKAPTLSPSIAFTQALPLHATTVSAGIQAIISDKDGNIISSTLPGGGVTAARSFDMAVTGAGPLMQTYTLGGEAIPVTGEAVPVQGMTKTTASLQNIWDGTDGRFITEVQAIPQGTLTLITPMSRIRSIEQALLGRLLLIVGVGAVLMIALSLLLTKRLIKPLMKLNAELKKVKDRRFSEVQLVQAGGELGSVARNVFEMAGELNRYTHVQKQFFQNASHELKTPLMSISGYAEGIREGIFEGEDVNKGLDIIMEESSRLKKLVMEMTLLAKLDSEEDIFKLAEVNVKELLTETIERVNPMLKARGLTMQAVYSDGNSLTVQADRDKLLQALLNVASNAIRYAKSNISMHAAVQNGFIEISVSDDGEGIAEELLPYLFHRFVKGKDGESGLGLAISRAIVERCGGLIAASNMTDGGAQIRIGFPAAA